MKSRQRKQISDGVDKLFSQMKQDKQTSIVETVTPQEGMGLILGMGTAQKPIVEKAEPVQQSEIAPSIKLELKEGLKGASGNYTKYPNEIHEIFVAELNPYESVAFMWIWRISWGFGRNYCRFGQSHLLKNTSLKSLRTVQRVIPSLREKKFILAILSKDGERDVNNEGSLYRVCTPEEIITGITEEGIPLDNIPYEGIASQAIASRETRLTGDTGIASQAIASQETDGEKSSNNTKDERYRLTGYSLTGEHIKKGDKEIKEISLSNIIDSFYKGIGQTKISKAKRERAESDIKELQKEGYSLEEIAYAAKWATTPGNIHEKLHSFGIIKQIIGQALAYMEKEDKQAKQLEADELARQAEEAEKQKIKRIRDAMSDKDLAALRERATKEIEDSGKFSKEFISDALIQGKENEILRRTKNGW